mmetsp:Transcript_22964/g.35133  ORF Transcript_22964/g.35133 Transcript_22964/m.35133 type:complete len:82 (-) Transcript_22964:134-379(-)
MLDFQNVGNCFEHFLEFRAEYFVFCTSLACFSVFQRISSSFGTKNPSISSKRDYNQTLFTEALSGKPFCHKFRRLDRLESP